MKNKEETTADIEEHQKQALPPIDFSTFVLSLASSAMVQLGEVSGPDGEKRKADCSAARQTIDILGIIEEKTKNNLTESEEKLLKSLLYDLRIKIVDVRKESTQHT